MAEVDNTKTKERPGIIESVKTLLGFFALCVLVAESVLLALVTKAEGKERIIILVGMIVIILVSAAAVVYLSLRQRIPAESDQPKLLQTEQLQILSFEKLLSEIKPTIDKLQKNEFQLAGYYFNQGDFQRLLDGLYSNILYIAGSVPTGFINPIYYGNLMDWDQNKNSLRVRYFKGPYNDEIITRSFPLNGPKLGVVSMAVTTGKIQYFNSMESELKERGESRLKAMVSIPVETLIEETAIAGNIMAINIDSVVPNVFPTQGSEEIADFEMRANTLASLVRMVNELRLRFSAKNS
jgi:hypothetical protein